MWDQVGGITTPIELTTISHPNRNHSLSTTLSLSIVQLTRSESLIVAPGLEVLSLVSQLNNLQELETTMMNTFLFLATLSLAQAQIVPLAGPRPLWSTNIPASSEGNACKMYGMDSLLVCTGADGSTTALKPDADDTVGGTAVWSHSPGPITGTQTYSSSGVVFGTNPTIGNYIIHAVSEGFPALDPSFW